MIKRVLTALAATLLPLGASRRRRYYRRGTAPADQLAGDCHVPDFRRP